MNCRWRKRTAWHFKLSDFSSLTSSCKGRNHLWGSVIFKDKGKWGRVNPTSKTRKYHNFILFSSRVFLFLLNGPIKEWMTVFVTHQRKRSGKQPFHNTPCMVCTTLILYYLFSWWYHASQIQLFLVLEFAARGFHPYGRFSHSFMFPSKSLKEIILYLWRFVDLGFLRY